MVGWVLAAILVTVLAVAVVRWAMEPAVRRWRDEFAAQVQAVGVELNRHRTRLDELTHQVLLYDPGDLPPYGPAAVAMQEALTEAERVYDDCRRRRRQLMRGVGQPPTRLPRRLAAAWWAAAGEPWQWWQLRRQAGGWALCDEAESWPGSLRAVTDAAERLRLVPVETARRARAAGAAAEGAWQAVQALAGAGLRGRTFDEAGQAVEEARTRLAALPVHWRSGTDDAVLGAASRDSTIATWQALDEIEGLLRDPSGRLDGWRAQLAKVQEAVSSLQEEIALAALAVTGLERTVDAPALAAALASLQGQALDVAGSAAAPAADALPQVAENLVTLAERARGLSNEAAGLRSLVERLHSIVPRIGRLLDAVETLMTELVRAPAYAVDWGSYNDQLKRLRVLHGPLEMTGVRIAAERLRKHALLAEGLLKDAQDLNRQVKEVAGWREALSALLSRPELASGLGWLAKARATATEVARYAPANWRAEQRVAQLAADVEDLAERLGHLPTPGERLPAAGLGPRLQALQQAGGEIEPLLARRAAIATRLVELETAERSARDSLESLLPVMDSLAGRLRTGHEAIPAALSGMARALADRARRGRALQAGLEQREVGRVEDKAGQVTGWTRSVQRELREAQQALGGVTGSALAALRRGLEDLQAFGPLAGEHAVRDARELVAAPGVPGAHRAAEAQVLAAEVDRQLGTWQQAEGLLERLQTEVLVPLQADRDELEGTRRQASTAVEQLDRLRKDVEAGEWPVRGDIQAVKDRWQAIQKDEQRVKGSVQRVDEVRRHYEHLAERHRALVTLAAEARTTLISDQERVQTQGRRLVACYQALATYAASRTDDVALSAALAERVADIERELGSRKRRWQGRPPRAGDVLEELADLWGRLHADLRPEGSRSRVRVRDLDGACR